MRLVVFAAGALTLGAAAVAPVDYRAYDSWNVVVTPVFSDDGRYLAYVLKPEDGDPTLVVRDETSGKDRRETRASNPVFADNGRFVVFMRTAPIAAIDAATRAHKPADQMPHGGAGILDLQSEKPAVVSEQIEQIAVPKDGGAVIALRAYASPTPKASSSPNPLRVKKAGGVLTIEDLAGTARVEARDATDVVVSADDRFVAYATQSLGPTADGVHLYDVRRGVTLDVASGEGRYRNLAIAKDGSVLAFLSDNASYASDAPHDALYVVDLHAAQPVAIRAVDAGASGLPAGSAPSSNGTVAISDDGKRVFFGTAAAPTPRPSSIPERMPVDLWSWNDDSLQSQQKHDAPQERMRTYAAVYNVEAKRFAQLGSAQHRTVEWNQNPRVALAENDVPYLRAESWIGETYADICSVALSGGPCTPLATHAHSPSLSPGGRFALYWDQSTRHWISVDTAGGKRVVLAPHAPVRFDLENDDRPQTPQAYGMGGWIAGDRGVFIYDRYDVWLADPQTGNAIDFTHGAGRATHTAYSPVQTDPRAYSFDAAKPVLLSLIDERSYASGYARVPATGGVPITLLKRDAIVFGDREPLNVSLHDITSPPVAARKAPQYAYTIETFRDSNLWTSDDSFAHPVKVSDANPQQSQYRWGTERMISYRLADGTPMRAVMLVPDGLAPNRHAPMLVYFYEIWTPMYHSYYRPAPGTEPNLSRYVSNGYVMLLPDVRYRAGHPGKSALECIMPAVDAAVATGYVDPAKIGVSGHSWAAYQINYMLTKTHRFRAAEAGAAVDDMFSAYGGIRLESGIVREFQYERTQSRIGATPWDRPDLYMENSGLFGIKNVTTPYLSIHNDQDGAVPQFQGIEFVTAMRRLGKTAYMFSYDGEYHGLHWREQQKNWTVRLDQWFDYWLKGAARPSWFDGIDYLHRGEQNVDGLYGEPVPTATP
ncbi:MAG TPA: prolyl oligopeptidase family serine peptidase [Candidatus Baltobacteraceae bacterium]|nr:prolyl oligopeptidase family serine peptidase [Candidatus Baltobacteraceae bacterium]